MTTRQLLLTSPGGPLNITSTPTPSPGANEVLIRNHVVALNGIDAKQRDLGIGISPDQYPRVLGIEGAGVIDAVGADVRDGLKVGDEVSAWEGGGAQSVSWGGAYQERVVVPAHFVARKPRNKRLEEMASLPIAFVTAVCALVYGLTIPLPFLRGLSTEGHAPSSILILGGSSAVDAAAIQLLRTAYLTLPILATASRKHHARPADLGASHVTDYRSPTVEAALKAASPGARGVDVILDCVSAGAIMGVDAISDLLHPGGGRKYAALQTGVPISVGGDVQKINVGAHVLGEMQGGMGLIGLLTELLEEGKYRVPLPVRVVGRGSEILEGALEEVKGASGEKVVVML